MLSIGSYSFVFLPIMGSILLFSLHILFFFFLKSTEPYSVDSNGFVCLCFDFGRFRLETTTSSI